MEIIDKLLKNKGLIFMLLWDEYKDSLYNQEALRLVRTIQKIGMYKDNYILEDYIPVDRDKLKDLLEIVNRFEKTENESKDE